MPEITMRVPQLMSSRRFAYLRARNIIRAQLRRQTWAGRLYRLAVRIHGGPQTYMRVETPDVHMLIPKNRWDAHASHIHLLGPNVSFRGGLLRSDVTPEEKSVGVRGEPGATNCRFQDVHVGGFASRG